MRTLLALALLLTLLPPAAVAQLPTQPQACGPLDVVATAPQALREGETGEVAVTVKNNGNRAVDVTVAAETSSPGWAITSATSQTANVPAGGSAAISFAVSPSGDASGDATVNVATTGVCPAPGGLPCPAGAPPNSCSTQGPAQTVVVGYEAQDGFGIPFLSGLAIPLPYLLAGVLLVLAAIAVPLLLRRKRPARATATCPEPMKPVRPGRGASFPIDLANPADVARKVQMSVGPVPEGWSAFLPLPEIQLAPKEKRSLWLMVRAPPDASDGSHADVEVTAVDTGRPERPSLVRVRAEVRQDAPETASP